MPRCKYMKKKSGEENCTAFYNLFMELLNNKSFSNYLISNLESDKIKT